MNYMDTNKLNPIIIIIHLSSIDSFCSTEMRTTQSRVRCVFARARALKLTHTSDPIELCGFCYEQQFIESIKTKAIKSISALRQRERTTKQKKTNKLKKISNNNNNIVERSKTTNAPASTRVSRHTL